MPYSSKMSGRSDTDRIQSAVAGITNVTKNERVIRVLIVCGLGLILILLFFVPSWILIKQSIILFSVCIICEIFNTAIEDICNIVQPNKDPRIKKIKDISAGAVFLMASITIIITAIDLYFVFF